MYAMIVSTGKLGLLFAQQNPEANLCGAKYAVITTSVPPVKCRSVTGSDLAFWRNRMQRADAEREVPCSQIGHVQHSKTTIRDAVKKVISKRTLDRIYVEFGGYKR